MSEEVEWDPSYDVEINQETSFCKYLPQQSRSYRCKRLISWRTDEPSVLLFVVAIRGVHRSKSDEERYDEAHYASFYSAETSIAPPPKHFFLANQFIFLFRKWIQRRFFPSCEHNDSLRNKNKSNDDQRKKCPKFLIVPWCFWYSEIMIKPPLKSISFSPVHRFQQSFTRWFPPFAQTRKNYVNIRILTFANFWAKAVIDYITY